MKKKIGNAVIMPLVTGDLKSLNIHHNIHSIKKVLYIIGKNLLCLQKHNMYYYDIKDNIRCLVSSP